MADLISNSPTIQNLYQRFGWFKSSPARMAQITCDYINEIMQERVDIVDPTNPFIMLLEASCVHSAAAVNESLLNLRKTYPCLAHTDEEIYRHMTDKEYLGRFCLPSRTNFTFIMELNALQNELVFDDVEQCYKGTIPRDTYHTVDEMIFTHEYPIVFRYYPSTQVLQITYDVSITSPITLPSNNIVQYTVRRDPEGIRWLHFTVPLRQMEIATTVFPIQKQSVFRKDIQFSDQFLYARVYNKSNANENWTELKTTHSDQIFDITEATAVLTVTTGNLNVVIPYVYNNNPVSLAGQIRVDVYTSRGELNVNLSSYTLEMFTTQFRALNEERDITEFTNVWSQVSMLVFSNDVTREGRNGLPFSEIRRRVVNYATGVNEIPITTSQLDPLSYVSGFDIIRNADPMTDRAFLGMKRLPTLSIVDTGSKTAQRINRVNMGMVRFSTTIQYLEQSDNVINHSATKRLTMRSNTAFKTANNRASMVNRGVVEGLKLLPELAQIATINADQYLFTPYYYVFDPENQLLEVRAYDLDRPVASDLNFIRQNQSLRLPVNTGQYSIEKVATGYRLTVVTSSGTVFKGLDNAEVGVQIRMVNREETKFGFIKGVEVGTVEDTQERIYTFDIHTSHDINTAHDLHVTNAFPKLEESQDPDDLLPITNFFLPLSFTLDILYTTSSITQTPVFIPDETDELFNRDIMPFGTKGNTHDTLKVVFGKHLDHLWTRVRTYADVPVYQTTPADIPAIYEADVYETDPVSGSIFQTNPDGSIKLGTDNRPLYNKLHNLGDPVLDGNGEPVFKFNVNDVLFDDYGRPIVQDSVGSISEFDIFVLDGKLLFVTDQLYKDYLKETVRLITQWITEDLLEIQARLLERTKIFFYPETSLGVMQVKSGERTYDYMDAEQKLRLIVFADEGVVKDPAIQAGVSTKIVNYLDEAIRNKKFTLSALETDLRYSLGSNVFGVSIFDFGGDKDYQSIVVKDEHHRLGLKKRLALLANNIITLEDDITITYQTF